MIQHPHGLDNYVKSVARELHWTPDVIGNLYFDDIDYEGLIYWYNDIREVNGNLKKQGQ